MTPLDVINGTARWAVVHGDCREVVSTMPDASVDAVVTDPPAGIAFMGKAWDRDKGGRDEWIKWLAAIMKEALRVLKPGGHALVWALPRTSHWTATAVEDAGFEIRDVVVHLFGSGFPKSLNIGGGWGTALKPASEHWILARKPLGSTVAACFAKYGTGALNIDACRIATDWNEADRPESWKRSGHTADVGADKIAAPPGQGIECHLGGRWPANVVFSHDRRCFMPGGGCWPDCPVAELDRQSGESASKEAARGGTSPNPMSWGSVRVDGSALSGHNDTGGASRFFYVAKPSTAEREAGCEALPKRAAAELVEREEGSAGMGPRAGAGRTSAGRANVHPTVKSIELMRWLTRLVTPRGGVVLDMFAGSGTTGCAAVLEQCRFIGIELDPENAGHVAIARARIAYWDRTDEARQIQMFAEAGQ